MIFKGSMTALVTPFRHGEFDAAAFRDFIEFQIEKGTDGIVPCGTTGESATLSHAEHVAVMRAAVEAARGRVPVLAGTGSNNTREAVELTRAAKEVGADGCLLITPYYNKPTQQGFIEHCKAILKEVPLPMVVYNVPGRTCFSMTVETIAELARIPNIVGVKEATGDMVFASRVLEAIPPGFSFLSGDDFTFLPSLVLGGHGCISVTSNVDPAGVARIYDLATAGDWKAARQEHHRLTPLHTVLFSETNPIPVKAGVSMLGMCTEEIRLPMTPAAAATKQKLSAAMRELGLLPQEK
ncbi:MAG: 4-hydroxy-tetrahydrodipicolinate synthase [Myxococcota bacterium]|nr:4-hydroxy-tetrahydrodipicolinate synthase [Myxococcota bacterium]